MRVFCLEIAGPLLALGSERRGGTGWIRAVRSPCAVYADAWIRTLPQPRECAGGMTSARPMREVPGVGGASVGAAGGPGRAVGRLAGLSPESVGCRRGPGDAEDARLVFNRTIGGAESRKNGARMQKVNSPCTMLCGRIGARKPDEDPGRGRFPDHAPGCSGRLLSSLGHAAGDIHDRRTPSRPSPISRRRNSTSDSITPTLTWRAWRTMAPPPSRPPQETIAPPAENPRSFSGINANPRMISGGFNSVTGTPDAGSAVPDGDAKQRSSRAKAASRPKCQEASHS